MTLVSGDTELETPHPRRRWWLALVVVTVVAVAAGVAALWASAGGRSSTSHPPSAVGDQPGSAPAAAADFLMPTADGQQFSVPAGKPTILLFMTTQGCASCVTQARAIDQVARTDGGRVAVLGVEMDPTVGRGDLNTFSHDLGGLHYPLAIDHDSILQRRFQAAALSTVVILKTDGSVVYRAVDPSPAALDAGLRQAAAA
jgi:peroxiredoxin